MAFRNQLPGQSHGYRIIAISSEKKLKYRYKTK
jgi:hypothetical protein